MNISTLIWTNSSIKALFLKKKSVVMNRRNKYILHKITCLWQNGNKIWNQAAPVWLDLGCNVSPALLYHLIKITPIVCLPGWWKSVVVGSHCLKFVDLSLSLSLPLSAAILGCSRRLAPYRVSQPASHQIFQSSNRLRKFTRSWIQLWSEGRVRSVYWQLNNFWFWPCLSGTLHVIFTIFNYIHSIPQIYFHHIFCDLYF